MRMTDIKISNYLPALKENSRLIFIVLLASCLTSFLGSEVLLDDHYWSEAEIQVLRGGSSPIGSEDPNQLAILVRERITREFLERIVVDNRLYPKDQRISLARAIQAMQKDIATTVVQEDVVRLAFRASDPGLAQRITQQLAAKSVSAESQVSSLEEDRVLSSLLEGIKKAEADLAKQEEKVKDFNLRFLGGQVEKQTETLAKLNRLILQLESNAELLNALQEEKSSQERFLIQRPSQEPSGEAPDSKFQSAAPTGDSLSQSNPTGLSFAERKVKIDEFTREIDQRKKQQAEIRKEMAAYQSKIDTAPKARAIQSGIARDYDKAKLHYQELLAKKNEADIAKAAKTQLGPSFKLLSAASFPEAPSETRNQLLAKLSWLLWGPLVAIGLVRLRSKTMAELSLEEVISQSGVTVLASIPWIPLDSIPQQAPDRDSHRSSAQTTK